MKIIDSMAFRPKAQSIEYHLDSLMYGYSERGTLEQVEADIEAMRQVLVRFMALQIHTVDQLNELAGYKRFEERP